MNNPFIFEQLATGDSFCGRKKELDILAERTRDNKNSLLISRRRIGKSSLVIEFFKERNKKKVICVYVDLFEILDAVDFARLLYKAAAEALPWSVDKFFREAGRLFKKTTFEAIPSNQGVVFRPSLSPRDFNEYLTDALDGLSKYAADEKMSVVIAFDEFQQIATIKNTRIDAVLRKYMQQSKNMSFIFLGSKRHMLKDLFHNQNQPLYKMASTINLGSIDKVIFHKFIEDKLNRKIDHDVFEHLFDLSAGESKLIQQICYHVFNQKKKSKLVSVVEIEYAIERILNEDDDLYRTLFNELTLNNKKCLRYITENNGINLYVSDSLLRHNLTKSALQRSLKTLQEKEVIDVENERWAILDRTYHLWVQRLYR